MRGLEKKESREEEAGKGTEKKRKDKRKGQILDPFFYSLASILPELLDHIQLYQRFIVLKYLLQRDWDLPTLNLVADNLMEEVPK